MSTAHYDQPYLFEAFIKASQYIVRLTTQQDVWDNLGKLIATFFPGGWTAFVHRSALGDFVLDNCTLSKPDCAKLILSSDVRTAISDVLDSGFLTTKTILIPFPSLTVLLPIVGKTLPHKVMLIGHSETEALPKELLNIYLALAGLAGATFERIESERVLTRQSVQLEASVKEATADLARSNHDLEQFAYVASHDLQEPLRAVMGFLGLLQKRSHANLDSTAQEYIAFAVEGAQRMSHLISDLLAYSRVDQKGDKPKTTDTSAALETALANLQVQRTEISAIVSNDALPFVIGDQSQIVQLFQNFIGNALKFHHGERQCLIHIGARLQGDWWTFSVKDNGIGIAPEHFERIFAIFQRLHTREKYLGTGIGLAICKKIVERQGGRIWVESKPEEGSTFFFTLRAAEKG